MLNLLAVIVPAELISPTVIVPSTAKSFIICKSLFGIRTFPVPFARSSKSVFEVVVVTKLSSINTSSNCAERVTVKLPPTAKSLVIE